MGVDRRWHKFVKIISFIYNEGKRRETKKYKFSWKTFNEMNLMGFDKTGRNDIWKSRTP